MTTTDVRSPSDVPMCEMTVGEWADAMIVALQKLPVIEAVTFMHRMTQEQRDLIRARIQMQAAE